MQDLLGLNGEQREQLLAHRHIKLVSLARLVQERRELQLKLQVRPLRMRPPLSDRHPCCPKVSVLMIGRRVAPCILAPGKALYAPQHMSLILLLVREIMHAEESADSVCTDADGE